MKEKNIDEKTRVKLKWLFYAMGYAICLQRKRWYGWKTTSWIYPEVIKGESSSYVLQWLYWNESGKNVSCDIGEKIIDGIESIK